MSRARLRPVYAGDLGSLPDNCSRCPLGAGNHPGCTTKGQVANWARAAQAELGQCGVAVGSGAQTRGFLLFTPPLHVPRHGPQSGGAMSPDAAVIMSVRVFVEDHSMAVLRQLVQAAAAHLARGRNLRALEVQTTRGPGSCALPDAAPLEALGFQVVGPHSLRPRLRLDLSRTVRWPRMAPLWDRINEWVRTPPLSPANRRTQPIACPGLLAGDPVPPGTIQQTGGGSGSR